MRNSCKKNLEPYLESRRHFLAWRVDMLTFGCSPASYSAAEIDNHRTEIAKQHSINISTSKLCQ